jgi:hypothetical protein
LSLAACRTAPKPAVVAPPPQKTAPAKCPSLGEELESAGPDVRTIDVVVYSQEEECIQGDARHFQVEVDDKKEPFDIGCHAPKSTNITIMAPTPGYDVGSFVVDAGDHTVRVVDLDTHHEDGERMSVPHVEWDGRELEVGNHVDAYVDKDGVHVAGPSVMRMPRL